MRKNGNKSRSLGKTKLPVPTKPDVGHFSKFASHAGGISLPERFRAAVAFDSEKRPRWFLFDMFAFWELLCRVDEVLAETLPNEEYFSKNPVGGLIDKLEGRWPFKEESKAAIRREYERALKDIAAGRVRSLTV